MNKPSDRFKTSKKMLLVSVYVARFIVIEELNTKKAERHTTIHSRHTHSRKCVFMRPLFYPSTQICTYILVCYIVWYIIH